MRTFAPKQNPGHQTTSAGSKDQAQGHGFFAQNHAVPSILHLQRTIGNQPVLRLLQTNADLEAGLATTASTRFEHDFSQIPVNGQSPVKIQPKLAVNTSGDIYEQEADRMAEKALR